MKKPVSVSNLTLDLWLDFVRPALRATGMLEEALWKDGDREVVAEVIDEAFADDLEHCMTIACFNAHGSSVAKAAQMVYQLGVSAKYRPATSSAASAIQTELALTVATSLIA